MPVQLTIEQRALLELGRALRREADGKELRRDLIRELKKPLAPAVAEIKSGVMAIGAGGLPPGEGEPLRSAVVRRIRSEVKLSGHAIGVRVRARKTEAVRGFRHAPKRLNSPKGWRHPVHGHRNLWVVQFGNPNYFDRPLEGRRSEFRSSVLEAMEATARRIRIRILF
jgi:hypothetical protein